MIGGGMAVLKPTLEVRKIAASTGRAPDPHTLTRARTGTWTLALNRFSPCVVRAGGGRFHGFPEGRRQFAHGALLVAGTVRVAATGAFFGDDFFKARWSHGQAGDWRGHGLSLGTVLSRHGVDRLGAAVGVDVPRDAAKGHVLDGALRDVDLRKLGAVNEGHVRRAHVRLANQASGALARFAFERVHDLQEGA